MTARAGRVGVRRADARRPRALGPAPDDLRVALAYLVSRVLLLIVAVVVSDARHQTRCRTSADGTAFGTRESRRGVPAHLVHGPSTLGFFPLLPVLMGLLGTIGVGAVLAGVVISLIGGLIASLLVRRLASGWWGPSAGLRAAVLFCLFPGSIVFSMAYGEGLLIPLAAGCILALERRRWLIGGCSPGSQRRPSQTRSSSSRSAPWQPDASSDARA